MNPASTLITPIAGSLFHAVFHPGGDPRFRLPWSVRDTAASPGVLRQVYFGAAAQDESEIEMVLRDIMVCLDGTLAGEGRLELGLNLARASKAYLTAVYCVPELHAPPPLPAGAGLPPTILGPVSPDGAAAIGEEPTPVPISAMPILAEAEHADTAEQRFRQELPLREIDGEWRSLDRDDLPELVQLAKSADLVILGQHPANETEGLVWLRPDDVMIEVGRPVLIVPDARQLRACRQARAGRLGRDARGQPGAA